MIIRITTPYFVAGVIPGFEAAPIIQYMRDWSAGQIFGYCAKKGWHAEVVTDIPTNELWPDEAIEQPPPASAYSSPAD